MGVAENGASEGDERVVVRAFPNKGATLLDNLARKELCGETCSQFLYKYHSHPVSQVAALSPRLNRVRRGATLVK